MKSGAKVVLILLSASVISLVGMLAWNHTSLQTHLDEVLQSDPRNSGADCTAHFRNYIDADVVIFDLQRIEGSMSPTDVFRILLQFAKKVSHRSFESVELAHKGATRFLVAGAYFQQIGREYGSQNPVFTMRTFPENLRRPNGDKAFSEWTGGLLGVTSRQLEDFNEFHKQWYLNDLISTNQ